MNILFILVDDLGYDDLGYTGSFIPLVSLPISSTIKSQRWSPFYSCQKKVDGKFKILKQKKIYDNSIKYSIKKDEGWLIIITYA
ncbi:hypothetical protein GCM10007383_35380 [Arenibacter certesii]|uniref:Sulfatase N-terminal domain-containing protein n=1 Tax=Arenibacter certesii TaxID=228955 RepID=A0A918J836_9FLAO|nr:hypothetical protein GCM10007383_35380 [Arenibacter certesii]